MARWVGPTPSRPVATAVGRRRPDPRAPPSDRCIPLLACCVSDAAHSCERRRAATGLYRLLQPAPLQLLLIGAAPKKPAALRLHHGGLYCDRDGSKDAGRTHCLGDMSNWFGGGTGRRRIRSTGTLTTFQPAARSPVQPPMWASPRRSLHGAFLLSSFSVPVTCWVCSMDELPRPSVPSGPTSDGSHTPDPLDWVLHCINASIIHAAP